ncbi:flagellar basal body-associated FliL family protein [Desulfolutivibrio sp.]|uniref:flagellar basal body-associated FliL family protein n=1 Tax=Desulfolutivibrio sp. TaxID=2773296 RepID=UPI002F966060
MSKDKGASSSAKAPAAMDDPVDAGLTKAKLDDTELSDELPKALQKVELDLDDAPFLEDEKDEQPPPAPEEDSVRTDDAPAPSPWWKKKAILFGGAGLVLVILAAAAYFLFFSEKKDEAPPPPPIEEEAAQAPTETPAQPPTPEEKEVVVVMEPFLVEQVNEKGESFLVSLQFTAGAKNPDLEKELARNTVVLRDAVYYYLKNKQLIFLDDVKVADALKQDIMSVMNQFLGDAQIETLFIEKYVVK